MNILVIEDDAAISNLVKEALELSGYTVTCVADGMNARSVLETHLFDLIILDLMLPDVNGLDLICDMEIQSIPIIILSAVIGSHNISKGLELGADDYLTKPFDVVELIARVNANLRRAKRMTGHVCYKHIIVDASAHTVQSHGETVNLTAKEYELLTILLQNRNITLSRSELYEQIWGDDLSYESRTLDLHILRLRNKLDLKESIESVYKYGYRLN